MKQFKVIQNLKIKAEDDELFQKIIKQANKDSEKFKKYFGSNINLLQSSETLDVAKYSNCF